MLVPLFCLFGYKFTNQYLSLYVTVVTATLYYIYILSSFNRHTQCIFLVRLERLKSFNNHQKCCQSESNIFTISFHRAYKYYELSRIMLHTTYCSSTHTRFHDKMYCHPSDNDTQKKLSFSSETNKNQCIYSYISKINSTTTINRQENL